MSERTQKRAEMYLVNLGLDWNSLRGKKTLDLGAGPADFALEANKKGVDVIPLEILPEFYLERGDLTRSTIRRTRYVKGDMTKLPFGGGVFDLVIEHATGGILTFRDGQLIDVSGTETEQVIQKTEEALRVLRDGGEYRGGPFSNDSFSFWRDLYPTANMGITREGFCSNSSFYLVLTK